MSWDLCERQEECWTSLFQTDTTICTEGVDDCCSGKVAVRFYHRVMCLLCGEGYRPYGLNTAGVRNCIANNYPQECYTYTPYRASDFAAACPDSPYRTNKCMYNYNNTWVEKGPGEPSPFVGGGCTSYKLCTADLKDEVSDLREAAKPVDTYHIMCQSCEADTHWEKFRNEESKGSCPAKSQPVFCAAGDGRPSETPPQEPVVVKQESWMEAFMRMLGFEAEDKTEAATVVGSIFVAALILICGCMCHLSRKGFRERMKNAERLAKEQAEIRRQKEERDRDLEMQRLKGENQKSRAALKDAKKQAKDKQKEAAEAKKRAKEEAEKGLPEGWRAFQDDKTGKFYYVEMATGETSWVKPVVENSTETIVGMDNGENAELKDQMRRLMESNRKLKKEIGQKDTGSTTKIESTKRKKNIGMFKSAANKIKLRSSSKADAGEKMALVGKQALLDVQVKSSSELETAPLPPPPGVPKEPSRRVVEGDEETGLGKKGVSFAGGV